MNSIILANAAAEVELEMDMQVKSEPESEDDSMNCNNSETSSVEEVMKPEHLQSDEEELEEEPLIEIESMLVPQELVKDEFEPTLLLFVNTNPRKADPNKSTIHNTPAIEKILASKEESFTKTDTIKEMSITKALRSVKRKRRINLHCSSEKIVKITKYKMKVLQRNTVDTQSLDDDLEVLSPPSGCSSDGEPGLSTKPQNSQLTALSKHVKGKKLNVNRRKKLKLPKISEQINKRNSIFEEDSSENTLSNDLNIKQSSLCGQSEGGPYNIVKESKGKENTQYNNEIENTAITVLIGGHCESNNTDENKSSGSKHELVKPSKPASYDCTVCGKQFKEKSHLATHARAHNDIRNFKCNECGLHFKTKTNLFYHMKTHEAPFNCLKCNKTFLQKKIFTRHMRVVHSGEGLYNCDICGRPFKSAQNLELHYTLHTGNKPFTCDVCHKSFVYKSTYRAHMKAHEADEQFDCEVCLAAGPLDKGELRRRCHHYSQARPWLCTVCGKGYPLKSTLKNHMKSHEAEKPFNCEECGKRFMKRQTYEIHLKTHSGEKPEFMCDQCSQSYFSFMSLKRHYMKHTGERNFNCDLCNKAFWTKDAMKVHRRSHENIKMFQCTQCSKSFAHKHTLVAHMRIHSGNILYSCEICYKTFVHKYHLTRHVRQHSALPFQHSIPPPPLPLTPSLYMLPPHTHHLDMPTLQVL